ncbi:MAG: hypothetical protein Q4F72_02595, partial [Desulfovibrionaceae bacterium]|nr:hypothetical protein [Desulfovibrionaceae bacterium]
MTGDDTGRMAAFGPAGPAEEAEHDGGTAPVEFDDVPPSENEGLDAWLAKRSRRKKEQEAAALARELPDPDLFDPACARLKELAAAGSEFAAYLVGGLLLEGDRLERDEKTALRLLNRAAKGGIGAAFALLAEHAEEAGDTAGAGRLALEGARLDSPGCALTLARLWLAARIRPQTEDAVRLNELLLREARRGCFPAMKIMLAIAREKAPLPNSDRVRAEAARLLMAASEEGDSDADELLARLLIDSRSVEPELIGLIRELLENAFEEGSASAGCALGEFLLEREDDDGEALRILGESSSLGSARASVLYGREMYRRADSRAKAQAFLALMRDACRSGEADVWKEGCTAAMLMCLTAFDPHSAQLEDGLSLLDTLRAEGCVQAAVTMAWLALAGADGGRRSRDEAMALLEESRMKGAGTACGALAEIFLLGLHGMPKDRERGLALALEGWMLDDVRSTALLVLDRRGGLDGGPWPDNPVPAEAVADLLVYLSRRNDALANAMAASAILSGERIAGSEEEDDEEEEESAADNAGRVLGSALEGAVHARDAAALDFI